jgi:DNA-binding response OmpR family regulator
MPFKILVIDDEIHDKTETISVLPALLESAGYEVSATADGETAYDLVFEYKPDIIVLDIRFGRRGKLGIEICKAIRENDYRAPIILITAVYTETEDVLDGFKAGADDYVRKPCDNREILARIRANLPPEVLEVDNYIRVDFQGLYVWVKRNSEWQEVHLQPLLFELLRSLVLNAGQIMESTRLKELVFAKEDISDDALAVYILRLRDKLEPDSHRPIYIENIRGVGYRFNGRPARAGQLTPQRRKSC